MDDLEEAPDHRDAPPTSPLSGAFIWRLNGGRRSSSLPTGLPVDMALGSKGNSAAVECSGCRNIPRGDSMTNMEREKTGHGGKEAPLFTVSSSLVTLDPMAGLAASPLLCPDSCPASSGIPVNLGPRTRPPKSDVRVGGVSGKQIFLPCAQAHRFLRTVSGKNPTFAMVEARVRFPADAILS